MAASLLAVWLLVDPRTPDLAAQVYRLGLYEREGMAVWDARWYGGHTLPGYSLLLGPLGSLAGIRVLAIVAALVSVVLLERIVIGVYGRSTPVLAGACLFAVAAVGDVWSGRVTFALGVAFAIACVSVWRDAARGAAHGAEREAGHEAERRAERGAGGETGHQTMRWRCLAAVALLAAACAAASPVAGVLLALAAVTYAIVYRAGRTAVAIVGAVALVVVPVRVLFPEGGFEPYPFTSFVATLAALGLFWWALPRGPRARKDPRIRVLRAGASLYALACGLCVVVHTPLGGNIERYAVLLAGPLLLCALGVADAAGARDELYRARWVRVGVAVGAIALWVVWGPARETKAVWGDPATTAAYYAPVQHWLLGHGAETERVEVPLTRSHWEAALLAPSVSLARGWEKQLEERYDRPLLSGRLTAGAYYAWLREQAVAYVALPDAPLDSSSAREGELIRGGLPYLRLVFSSAHWRVYAVAGATPIVSGPGRLSALGTDTFALDARAAGTMLVRVHYTPYLTVAAGDGCVASAPGGWTYVRARAPGRLEVAARFSLGRALGMGGTCRIPRAAAALLNSAGPGGGLAGAAFGSALGAGAAGAGEASAGETAPGGGGAGPSGPGYEWVGPIPRAALSIAAENRLPGTSAWRLPGPADLIGGEAHGAIAGYVADQAIRAGQTERVYVEAPGARSVRVDVYRMGWYGGLGGRLVLRSASLPVVRQPACTHVHETGLTECDWHPTLAWQVPSWLTSGVYIVKLTASDGAQSDCLFVVRALHPSALVVEIPTASYEAYNAWGGDSLYPGGADEVGVTGTDQGVEVSYDRPYESQTGAGQFFIREVAIVRFLERYGYPVSYTTIESIDGDPGQILGPTRPRAVMDVGHSEYWSKRDQQAFEAARERGTSLLFLSSDTMAWRVRFAPATSASSQAGEPDHRIVAYKEYVAKDPDRADPTGLTPGGGASLAGSSYNGCITPRIEQPGPPVYRYYSWRPDPSLQPSWLFAGTGVSAGSEIVGIVGYELDERTPQTPARALTIGIGTVPCQSEDEPSPVRGTVADSTLYTAKSGATVFATGTLGWLYGLEPVPQASPDAPLTPDPRVVAMTRNLLAHVLR